MNAYKNILVVLDGTKKLEGIRLITKAIKLANWDENVTVSLMRSSENEMSMYQRILDITSRPKIKITESTQTKLAVLDAKFNYKFARLLKGSGDDYLEIIKKAIKIYDIDLVILGYKQGVAKSIFSNEDNEDKELLNGLSQDLLIVPF